MKGVGHPDRTARLSAIETREQQAGPLRDARRLLFWAIKEQTGSAIRGYILTTLADLYAIREGYAWCSMEYLAKRCEVSVKTVRVHVNALEAAGLISIERRRKADGSHNNHRYRFPHLEESQGDI
jgi:DNA-binding transcriptional ArsR family regulator